MVHKCLDGKDPPGSPWDYALMAAALLAALPFFGANVLIATHMRRRPYVIAQGGAPLILLSSVSGFIWLVSTFVTTLHIPQNRIPFLRDCILWSFWLRLAFGSCLWLISLVLRLHRLYLLVFSSRASVLEKSYRTWILHLPLLWVPTLVFVGTATALHGSHLYGQGSAPSIFISALSVKFYARLLMFCSRGILMLAPWKITCFIILMINLIANIRDTVCAYCHMSNVWKWLSFGAVSIIYFLIMVFLLFQLKNCKDYVVASEYKSSCEFAWTALLCTFLYAVTIVTHSDKSIPGRCFVTFCVCCLVYVHFWVRMGLPVYLYLFKGESQLDSFEEEMLCCGAECFDKIHSPSASSHSPARVSFPAEHADWILRATSAAMVELSECKEATCWF